jgi:hypothetical protein
MKPVPDERKDSPDPSPPYKPPLPPLPAEGNEPQPMKSPWQAKVTATVPSEVSVSITR